VPYLHPCSEFPHLHAVPAPVYIMIPSCGLGRGFWFQVLLRGFWQQEILYLKLTLACCTHTQNY